MNSHNVQNLDYYLKKHKIVIFKFVKNEKKIIEIQFKKEQILSEIIFYPCFLHSKSSLRNIKKINLFGDGHLLS